MELQLEGWIGLDEKSELGLSKTKSEYARNYWNISEKIMNYFGYEKTDVGFGQKTTFIPNAHLSCWFSDEQCTLEETQMNFESYSITGELLTAGHYVGYSEWTITGFDIDCFIIGGHDLNKELRQHEGQYIHLILTD